MKPSMKLCKGCKRKVRWDEVEMVPCEEVPNDLVPMHVIDDPDPQWCGPVEE